MFFKSRRFVFYVGFPCGAPTLAAGVEYVGVQMKMRMTNQTRKLE